MFGEDALWYYKRGAARAALGRDAEATPISEGAIGLEGRKWVHGRAHLELGKLALKAGKRPAAGPNICEAARLCDSDNDQLSADEARQLLRQLTDGFDERTWPGCPGSRRRVASTLIGGALRVQRHREGEASDASRRVEVRAGECMRRRTAAARRARGDGRLRGHTSAAEAAAVSDRGAATRRAVARARVHMARTG